MKRTTSFLRTTAIEKIIVLGEEDSKEDIKKMRDVIEELTDFWDLTDVHLNDFDKAVETVLISMRE